MKYDDLSFEMINEDGLEIKCDILSVVPDLDKTYIVFTDYKLDYNDDIILQYGEILENQGIIRIDDKKTIKKIKKLLGEVTIGIVNREVQQNLE